MTSSFSSLSKILGWPLINDESVSASISYVVNFFPIILAKYLIIEVLPQATPPPIKHVCSALWHNARYNKHCFSGEVKLDL